MQVLVIGGTEFISLHLVRALLRDGHQVAVLNRGRNPARLPAGVRTLVCDRTDHAALRKTLASERCDALVDITYAPTTGADAGPRRRGVAGCPRRPRRPRLIRVDGTGARSRAADPLPRGHAAQPLLGRLRQEQDRGRGRADAALARAEAPGDDRAAHARVRPAQHAEQ